MTIKERLSKLFRDIERLELSGDDYQNGLCDNHIEDLQSQAKQLELDMEQHERNHQS